MSGAGEERLEELLRVNAELAAEIRALRLGRIDAPRSAAAPAVRRVDRLQSDLEDYEARAAYAEPALHAANLRIAALEAETAELRSLAEAHRAHIAELRGGWRGLWRRLAARISRAAPGGVAGRR